MALTKVTNQMILGNSASVETYGTSVNTAVQSLLDNYNQITFLSNTTTTLSADMIVPSDRKIIIEKGAVVISSGRFTSYDRNNVEWQIDGELRSVAMTTAPAIPGWPNTAAGTQNGNERGFIEFGGSDPTISGVSGFTVCGSGKITGDWAGTPNFSDSVRQVNRKGIASWWAKNVRIRDIEISGFEGEQVYAAMSSPDCTNVIFDAVYSHSCRFNALNFNVGNLALLSSYLGLKIINCTTDDCFAGIEASAGVIQGNFCRGATDHGIWFGLGLGQGPISVCNNTVENCLGDSYGMVFSSTPAALIYDIEIHDNLAINSGYNAFAFNKLLTFSVKNNRSRGHAAIGAGKSFVFTNCDQGWVDGNITFDPGAFSTGTISTATSSVNLGSNPVISSGGTITTNDLATFFGFGGKYSSTTTYGARENQFVGYVPDVTAVGAGAEYVFKSGSHPTNSVYASIAGRGNQYDGDGTTGGVGIACVKASTSQALPTLAVSWDSDGKMNLFNSTTAAAPSYAKGAVYFDTTLNKMRVGGATGWETITSV